MDSIELQRRVKAAKDRAHGRWPDVLEACGIEHAILNRRNQPCPLCGGTDRFQFTDKGGDGGYYCRGCGPGDPFKLLRTVLGLSFIEALRRIEDCVGTLPARADMPAGVTPERMNRLVRKIWAESRPITLGDEADRYLRGRGITLTAFPRSLRLHPALGYFEKAPGQARATQVAQYPAMVACIQGPDGHAITLHRTYLAGGHKARGAQSKKVLSSGINGAAVRLAEPTTELAITEGIETGLAVQLGTGKAVWAALGCVNLERLWVPGSVTHVGIYADNDSNAEFAGQAAAYLLARRLMREARRDGIDRRVQVFVPRHAGTDWADVWVARIAHEAKAA
jgi:putative DNA primase/helicase